MSATKIAIGVLILIAILFVGGLFAFHKESNADSANAPWVDRVQKYLPAPPKVKASEIAGNCLQAGVIRLRANTSCAIEIAGQGPTMRSLTVAIPAAPDPASGENVDVEVTPKSSDGVAVTALLRSSDPKERQAELKILKEGASVGVTCKFAPRGMCSLLLQ